MKSIWWGLSLFLCINCAVKKTSSNTSNFLGGVHLEPLDSVKRIDSRTFQDSLIWIATSSDGSQIFFNTDSVLWLMIYNHHLGKYESTMFTGLRSVYLSDSVWTLHTTDSVFQMEVIVKCGQPIRWEMKYRGHELNDYKFDFLVPSIYHDIYVLVEHNHRNLRDWKNFSNQVTLEFYIMDKLVQLYGKCGSYQLSFDYLANSQLCFGKASPSIAPCHLLYSEVELAATIQQQLVEVKRDGLYLKMTVPGDTLTFLKID
jgi:hypothetical protein